jgi:hypothetical protein
MLDADLSDSAAVVHSNLRATDAQRRRLEADLRIAPPAPPPESSKAFFMYFAAGVLHRTPSMGVENRRRFSSRPFGESYFSKRVHLYRGPASTHRSGRERLANRRLTNELVEVHLLGYDSTA